MEVVQLVICVSVQAMGVQGDVRKKEDASCVVEAGINEMGRLDILINGAAGNFLVSPEDLSPNGFKTGNAPEF